MLTLKLLSAALALAHAEVSSPEVLALDDECKEGESSCALNALQLQTEEGESEDLSGPYEALERCDDKSKRKKRNKCRRRVYEKFGCSPFKNGPGFRDCKNYMRHEHDDEYHHGGYQPPPQHYYQPPPQQHYQPPPQQHYQPAPQQHYQPPPQQQYQPAPQQHYQPPPQQPPPQQQAPAAGPAPAGPAPAGPAPAAGSNPWAAMMDPNTWKDPNALQKMMDPNTWKGTSTR
eukprot:TRINITY_DN1879_c0_g2_i2.p1 TRINITY_DN1879_c0_g2~~TRINITY_DN1879_c0_g2_i2.p1  ORF type:complete len:231 (+),score=58.55 TRINITY_DN1879_c0_g2_i2:75-767(+)